VSGDGSLTQIPILLKKSQHPQRLKPLGMYDMENPTRIACTTEGEVLIFSCKPTPIKKVNQQELYLLTH